MNYTFETIDGLPRFLVNGITLATYHAAGRKWHIHKYIPIRQRALLNRDLNVLYRMHQDLLPIESTIEQIGVMDMGKVGDGRVGNEVKPPKEPVTLVKEPKEPKEPKDAPGSDSEPSDEIPTDDEVVRPNFPKR